VLRVVSIMLCFFMCLMQGNNRKELALSFVSCIKWESDGFFSSVACLINNLYSVWASVLRLLHRNSFRPFLHLPLSLSLHFSPPLPAPVLPRDVALPAGDQVGSLF